MVPFRLITFLAVVVGIVALQIFLSGQPKKWPGLVLPAISLLISLLMVLGIATFSLNKTSGTVILENGVVEGHTTTQVVSGGSSSLLVVPYVFLLSNIPTAVLIGIYSACRGKLKRNREIEKMSIQDLE